MNVPFVQNTTFTGLLSTKNYKTSREWAEAHSLIQSNSANWNNAYNTGTVYQANSASYATNTTLESVSGLLTPLTLTNSLTSQLTLSSDLRLSDARTPVAHASSHAAGGTDELFDQSLNTGDSVSFSEIDIAGEVFLTPTVLGWGGEPILNLEEKFFYDGGGDDISNLVFGATTQSAAFYKPISFEGTGAATNAAITRTNLGLNTASQMPSGAFAPSNLYQDLTGNWNSAYASTTSQGTINGNLTVVGNISATGVTSTSAINLQTIPLSSVILTGETKTSTTSVTATDVYIRVVINGADKYLRLFDVI